MKRVLFFAVVFLGAIIFACNKKDTSQPTNAASESEIIDAAYNYFNAEVIPDESKNKRPDKFPIWSGAKVIQDITGTMVTVPVFISKAKYITISDGSHLSASEMTFLKIYTNPKGVKHYEVVTQIPDKDYVLGQLPFKGVTKVEDWKGNFISAWTNKNNKISPATFSTSIKKSPSTENTAPTICTVTDWYDCRTFDDGAHWDCNYRSTTMVCQDPPSTGGGGAGGGGGGTSSGPPAVVPITQLYEIKKVVDSLKNKCQKKALSNLKGQIFAGRYSIMLYQFFGVKAKSTLEFYSGNTGTADAKNLPGGVYPNAYSRIILSNTNLQNASQEYIVITIMHEILHAYFALAKWDPTKEDRDTRDHRKMANDYVCILADALTEMFPDMDYQEATALSWGGLEKTDVYQAMPLADRNKMEATNSYYRLGISGTKCQ